MVSTGIANIPVRASAKSGKVSSNQKQIKGADFTTVFEKHSDDSKTSAKVSKNMPSAKMNVKGSKRNEMKEIIQKSFREMEKNATVQTMDSEAVQVDHRNLYEEVASSLQYMLQEIVSFLSEKLNLSQQEVADTMSHISVDINQGQIQGWNELVCELTGSSEIDILMDSNLSDLSKDISSYMEEFVKGMEEEFDISKEHIGSVFNDVVTNLYREKEDVVKPQNTESVHTNLPEVTDRLMVTEESGETQADTSKEFTAKDEKHADTEHPMVQQSGLHSVLEGIQNALDASESVDGVDVSARIMKQITDGIKLHMSSDTTSLELQLNPEHLGKVSLTIASKAGVVTAQLVAENAVAKEAIESQMVQLRESLEQQGVKVEAIEVTIASKEFEQNLDKEHQQTADEQRGRRRRRISKEDLSILTGNEEVADEMQEEAVKELTNTTVSYTA